MTTAALSLRWSFLCIIKRVAYFMVINPVMAFGFWLLGGGDKCLYFGKVLHCL